MVQVNAQVTAQVSPQLNKLQNPPIVPLPLHPLPPLTPLEPEPETEEGIHLRTQVRNNHQQKGK